MKLRAALALALAVVAVSSCAPGIPDEPAVSASATEVVVADSTAPFEPETTAEQTEEVTLAPETEEITAEAPPETSLPEPDDIELLTAKQLLDFAALRINGYYSFRIHTATSLAVNVLGSETYTETDSELSVKDDKAFFKRGGKDGFEELYLVGDELYTQNEFGKCRIGGYCRESFLALTSDIDIISSFVGGDIKKDEELYVMTFSELGDSGKDVLCKMLGLPAEYKVSFEKAQLCARIDKYANLLSSEVEIEISVSMNGEKLMTVILRTASELADVTSDFELTVPSAKDYVFFTNDEALARYSFLTREIAEFTSSYDKFEYSVADDMMISFGTYKLPLTSKSVYAYNSRIGASIDKTFDLGDGTGRHTTLTHFNKKRGFSQIDGGSIFVDTTINANNLDFTLYYPFTTSFFSFEHCSGMDTSRPDASMIAFTLKETAAKNIADNLLLRVGVLSSSVKLGDVTAYTYIKLGADGKISAVGYEFSASADVDGKAYQLKRSVELKIISRGAANVKVIYIEVEDDE
jgi:hypothetical protein